MTYKTGRRPSDPAKLARRLWLKDYLIGLPFVLPDAVDHSTVGETLGELGNDTVGDCTIAATGHAIQVADWYGQNTPAAVTTKSILAVYSAITGYNPDDPNSDQGANLLDVLSYWQKTGIVGEKLKAYVAFDSGKVDHWKATIDLFGGAYIGVWLPKTVVDALDNGQVIDWTTTKDPVTKDAGHCVFAVGYDATGLKVVTWGRVITMSFTFAAKYCDEAYAPLMPSWASGKEPNNLNVAQLTVDLWLVQGSDPIVVPPDPTPPTPPPTPTPTPTPTPSPTPTPPAPPKPPTPAENAILKAVIRALTSVEKAVAKAIAELEELLT
jgi:hypothetical protein